MPTLRSRFAAAVISLLVCAGGVGHSLQSVTPSAVDARFDLGGDDIPDLVVGAGAGSGEARVFSGADLAILAAAPPFGPGFAGGVLVASGDIDGDGVADVVASMASSGGRVKAFSGAALTVLADFQPYGGGFTGGVSVAVGDTNADGHADLIVAPASGPGPIRVYSGADGAVLLAGTPLGADAGGFNLAAGDVNGDGRADIVLAQARGGVVAVFNGVDLSVMGSGAPYGPGFGGGVSVAVGDLNGDGRGEVITAPASGTGPVQAFDIASLALLSSGHPFGVGFDRGLRIAAADIDGDGRDEVVVGSGPGGVPRVRAFSGADQHLMADFLAFAPAFSGGVHVALPRRTGIRITSPNRATFTAGTSGSFTIRTAGAPPGTTIALSGALPTGVTFTDNADGTATLSGTPVADTGGTYALTVTAGDGSARSAIQALPLRVEEAAAITSAAATTFRIGQAGTFQVTTRGFPLPDLTSSGTLPAGVTFTDQGNGQATLAGTPAPGSGGTYTLTISATNGVGGTATQTFTLTVESAPAFTSPTAATFIVGVAQTFDITTSGEPPVTSITRTGVLPAGLTYVDDGDGTATVSGTAASGTGGSYPQTLTASNGVGAPATQVLTITVQQGPQITSAAATTFIAGTAGSFTVTTTGSPTPAISVTGALPAGVTLVDNGDGTATLSGTAAAGGSFPITISAANGIGTAATQSFELTVQQAPAITSAATAAFNVGTFGSFTVTAIGVPLPALAVTGALPSGVTFVDNANGTATLSGTLASGTAGTHLLTITATNGVGVATQDFSLVVRSSPAFTSASSATFIVGAADSFTVTASGSPAPTLSASGTLPPGVTFNDATGELAGTPTQTGTFAGIQFSATNGVPPDATQDFTLTVSCPAITISATTLPDGTYSTAYGPIGFTASGSTGVSLTWTAPGLPPGVTIGSTTGVVSGTPSTTVLNLPVTITATDEFGCSGARPTTISVRPSAADNSFVDGVGNTQYVVGGAPPATPHVYVAGSVLLNDNGPGALTATLATPPANGIVSLAADGTFVYTPNPGFSGPVDTFVYTLTDGNGVTDTAAVSIGLSTAVWYVQAGGPAGDGRSHNPFNTLAGAATPSQPGDTIFVHTGVGAAPGNLALKAGQVLWGQGAPFTRNALTIPATGRPTLSGTLTLASSVTVNSLAIDAIGGSAGIIDPPGPIGAVSIANGVSVRSNGAAAVTLSDAAGSFSFESISVTGGSSAISLTNVSGPFTVTGTGPPTSGGTIQNIVGDAIRLSNTGGLVSLSSMVIQDIGNMAGAIDTISGHQAIRGEVVVGGLSLTNVTMQRLSDHAILGSQFASPGAPTVWNGLTIANSTIVDSNRFHVTDIGDGGDEAMVRIFGIRGAVAVTGSTLQRGNEPLDLLATDGTLTMTVTSSSFQAYKEAIASISQPTVGQHCIDVRVRGEAVANVTVGDRNDPGLGNQFLNCRIGSIRVFHESDALGTVNAVVAGNTFTVDDHSSPAGADFFFPMGGVFAGSRAAAAATMNVLAQGNTFTEVTNASGGVGQLTLSAEGGTFQARVDGNSFVRPGNAPWFIRAAENQQGRIELRNNTVIGGFFNCPDPSCGGGYPAPGIRAIADVQRGGFLDLTIDGDAYARHDIGFDPGNTVEIQINNVGAPGTACAALRNNRSADGFALEQNSGNFNLYRWMSGASGTCTSGSPASCVTALADNGNTGSGGDPLATPPAVSVTGTINVTPAACGLPTGGIFQP